MNVGNVLEYINELAPWGIAEEWDNVGLMLGDKKQEVKKIFLCMDVTSETIDEAIAVKADLIVSHHPMFFSKFNTIDFETIKGSHIAKLIKNDISVISAHTNLDVAKGGVNDTLAELIGLNNMSLLKPYSPKGYDVDYGLGKVGTLHGEVEFSSLINDIKVRLAIDTVRVIGRCPEKVKNVAVFCGSFDGDLDSVKSSKVDVLITGDMKYHAAIDAKEMGLCIVDVGHFASENIIINKLKTLFDNRFENENVEIMCNTVEQDPFYYT